MPVNLVDAIGNFIHLFGFKKINESLFLANTNNLFAIPPHSAIWHPEFSTYTRQNGSQFKP